MGKKMTKAGMEVRRAIRADIDASPAADHLQFRSKFHVGEGIVESALTKTIAEWDALIAATPGDTDEAVKSPPSVQPVLAVEPAPAVQRPPSVLDRRATPPLATSALGLEQGFVKFARKPAKMGMDYVFWIPRVYVKNGLVDPACEYEVYLKRKRA